MIIEQIYTGCLSQGAYYIESNGEAAIIDPLREVDQYILKANKNKASIKYLFETHFHADFVSGHLTLSKKTNAPIIYGPNANTSFESINAKDGQRFNLGRFYKVYILLDTLWKALVIFYLIKRIIRLHFSQGILYLWVMLEDPILHRNLIFQKKT